jgi:molybdopterin-guanine dinucleotide biosynthesis protein A
VPEVSAVVLHSAWSQLGAAERAPLEGAAQPLLERVWSALTALSDDPLIVAGEAGTPPRHLLGEGAPTGARIVPDNHPHLWPLGALYAGLAAARHDRVLVVASDMPLLNLPLLRYMVLLSPDYDVVITRLAGNLEPLQAVYGRSCVPPLELALECGDPRIAAILPNLRVRYIDDTEVDTFDSNHRSFFRVQSVQDWEWVLVLRPGSAGQEQPKRRLAQRTARLRKR